MMTDGTAVGQMRVEAAIDRWQRELLDLSRNNRLLYFQTGPGRRGQSGVRIEQPAPGELFDRLANHERRQTIVRGLNQIGLPTFEPRGAFYAFPNISASGMSDEDFAEKLLREEHVAVVPGNAFGPGGEGFARMCYATEYSKIEEALHRMEKFMKRYG